MNDKLLIIFDLDGTLADAYKAIEKSLNFTRKKFGLEPVKYKNIKKSVGRGDTAFVKSFFPDGIAEKAVKIYRCHHAKSLKKYAQARLYARQLLYNLRRRKKILAIASNRPYYYTNIIIKKTGLDKYLDYVLCADQIKSLKPKPKILREILKKFRIKRKQAVYIGDMDIDMETAQRAKIDAVFIPGGSSRIREVKKYKNKVIARSLKDLNRLLIPGLARGSKKGYYADSKISI